MLSFQSNKLLCRVECCERKWFSALIAISTQHDTHLANSSSSPAITMNACNTREPPKALIIYPNSNSSISRFTFTFVLSPNDSNDTFTRRKLFVFQVSICFNAWSMHWSVYRSFLFYTTPQPISLHIQLYSTKLCASSSSLAASIPFLNPTRRTIRFLQMFRLCSLHYYSLLRVERIVCDVAVRNKFLATRKKKHQNWLEAPIKFGNVHKPSMGYQLPLGEKLAHKFMLVVWMMNEICGNCHRCSIEVNSCCSKRV